MALRGVRHGSARSPSWLCQESVMALKEFVQGRWPCEQPIMVPEGIFQLLRLAYASAGDIPSLLTSLRATTDSWQSHGGLLSEPQQTPGRAMADFWQSHTRLLAEPWRTSGRATTDSWQSHAGLLAEQWRTPGRAMGDFSKTQGSYFRISKT